MSCNKMNKDYIWLWDVQYRAYFSLCLQLFAVKSSLRMNNRNSRSLPVCFFFCFLSRNSKSTRLGHLAQKPLPAWTDCKRHSHTEAVGAAGTSRRGGRGGKMIGGQERVSERGRAGDKAVFTARWIALPLRTSLTSPSKRVRNYLLDLQTGCWD